MENVMFLRGTQALYDALETKDANTLYWLTDTQRLYKGDVLYAVGAEATNLASGLMSAADKQKLDSMSASGAGGLTAVDKSAVITDGKIGVQISNAEGNALELKDDGLYAAAGASIVWGDMVA